MSLNLRSSGTPLIQNQLDNNFTFLFGRDITGTTVTGSTLFLYKQDGTFLSTLLPVGGSGGTGVDTFVTGFTFTNGNTLTIGRNQGLPDLPVTINNLSLTGLTVAGTISATTYLNLPPFITGFTDTFVTGFTFSLSNYDLTIFQNNGKDPLTQNLSIFTNDVKVTGGTYNPSNGVATFYNNVGGFFDVPGFLTGYTDIDSFVTGFTFTNGNTLTITQNNGKTVPQVVINNLILTGLTVAGTISATTYLNLPLFTGNTSANCITDLYIKNVHGCDVVTVHDSVRSVGSWISATTLGFAFGDNVTVIGNYSHAEGLDTYSGVYAYFISGYSGNDIYLNSSYGNVASQFNTGGLPRRVITTNGIDVKVYTINGSSTFNAGLGVTIVPVTESTVGFTSYDKILPFFAKTPSKADQRLGDYSHAEGWQSTTVTQRSHAEGKDTRSVGFASHAEGEFAEAIGITSHAEGSNTSAIGYSSHAEGQLTQAIGDYSHSEGSLTLAVGDYSHAEGSGTTTTGLASHAEGLKSESIGDYSHAEGYFGLNKSNVRIYNIATGIGSHAEGAGNESFGRTSHAEGELTVASGRSSHSEGNLTEAIGDYSHAEGNGSQSIGEYSHAEGTSGAFGYGSHAEGNGTMAMTAYSHSEGYRTVASGLYSHAEGYQTSATTIGSHSEGDRTLAFGDYSHAEGTLTVASGLYSHAEGVGTRAIGSGSHSEGILTEAIGNASHAEGRDTRSIGLSSHAEGYNAISTGLYSHAEGLNTQAIGDYSHAEGVETTKAIGIGSHAEGTGSRSIGDYSHSEGTDTYAGVYAYTVSGTSGDYIYLNTSYGDVSSEFTASGEIVVMAQSVLVGYVTNVISSSYDGGLNSTLIRVSPSPTPGAATVRVFQLGTGEQSGADVKLGQSSHAEGQITYSIGTHSHAEGGYTTAIGGYSHAQGWRTKSIGIRSFASGSGSTASGEDSFIHSNNSIVTGNRSVVLGGQGISGTSNDFVYVSNLNINTIPTNNNSASQILVRNSSTGNIEYRDSSTLGGSGSTSIFTGNTSATCITDLYVNNIIECPGQGYINIVGNISAGEANQTVSNTSFAFGSNNTADATNSVALGGDNKSQGSHSFTVNSSNQASSDFSFASGRLTLAQSYGEIVRSSDGGRGQYSTVTFFGTVTSSATTSLYLDDVNTIDNFIVDDNCAYKINVYGIAKSTNNDIASYESQMVGFVTTGAITFIGGGGADGSTFEPLPDRSDPYLNAAKIQLLGNGTNGVTTTFTLFTGYTSDINVMVKVDYMKLI